jgi:hypothetical protein
MLGTGDQTMKTALLAALLALVLAGPARAENWIKYDNWFFYDAASATYDSYDDIVVVNTDEDVGWMMDEDEYWEYAWMAFRCNSDASWTWSEKNNSWGNEYTLDRSDEWDAAYIWTRDQLCARKSSLPYRDF